MRCFICQKVLLSLNNLFHHLKNIHNLDRNSEYRCLECSCVELFENLYSYKKHILQKHTQLQASEPNNELRTLLESWNQGHLSDYLIEEKITVDILKIFKRYHVWQLLRSFKMGDIILFENNLETWRIKIGKPLNANECVHYPYGNLISISQGIDHTINTEVSSNLPSVSSQKLNKDRTSTTASLIDEKMISNHNINLEDILSGAPIITDYYKKHKKFNEDQRKKLINLVARYFEENNIHLSLSSSYKLEKQILERFPTEKIEFYRNDKRGRIYMKFCNLKRSSKFISRDRNPKKNNENDENESTHKDPYEDFEIFVEEMKRDNQSDVDFDSV